MKKDMEIYILSLILIILSLYIGGLINIIINLIIIIFILTIIVIFNNNKKILPHYLTYLASIIISIKLFVPITFSFILPLINKFYAFKFYNIINCTLTILMIGIYTFFINKYLEKINKKVYIDNKQEFKENDKIVKDYKKILIKIIIITIIYIIFIIILPYTNHIGSDWGGLVLLMYIIVFGIITIITIFLTLIGISFGINKIYYIYIIYLGIILQILNILFIIDLILKGAYI